MAANSLSELAQQTQTQKPVTNAPANGPADSLGQLASYGPSLKPPQEQAYGATGTLPTGEAYYGPGLEGWWKGVTSRVSQPAYVKQPDGSYVTKAPTAAQYVGRGLKEGLMGLGTAFSQPAEWAQTALVGVPQALEDWADKVNSPLPDIAKVDLMNTSIWKANPLIVGALSGVYNIARIVTGKRQLASDEVVKNFQGNAIAGSKLVGSSFLDPGLRRKFMDEYMAGGNPDYIVAKLANPWAELVPDFVLDPLNFIGAGAAHATQEQKFFNAMKKLGEAVPEAQDGIKALLAATKAEDRAAEATKLGTIISEKIASKTAGVFDMGKMWDISRYTSTAKQSIAAENVGDLFGTLAFVFKGHPDDLGEALRALALIGGGKMDDAAQGVNILSRLGTDISRITLSDGGLDAAVILHRMMADESGVVDASKFLQDLKGMDQAQAIEKFGAKMDGAVKELYPSISELAKKQADILAKEKAGETLTKYEQQLKAVDVPGWAKSVAGFHDELQKKFVGGLNKGFSTMYISLNPGAGIRNVLGNMTHAIVDMGPAVVKRTAVGIDRNIAYINDLVGFVPKEAGILEDTQQAIGMFEQAYGKVAKLYRDGERMNSAGIVALSLENRFKWAMQEGHVIPETAELLKAGATDGQVKRLVALSKQFNGDAEKVLTAFRLEHQEGRLELWRDLGTILNKYDLEKSPSGLIPALRDALSSGTKDEVLAKFDDLLNHYKTVSDGVMNDIPVLINDERVTMAAGEIGNVGTSADRLDEFSMKLDAHRNAQQAWKDAVVKIMGGHNARNDAAFDGFIKATDEVTQFANQKSKELMAAVTPLRDEINKGGDLEKIWQKMTNLQDWGGWQKPEILTKQNLKKILYEDHYYPLQEKTWTAHWQTYRNAGTQALQDVAQRFGFDLTQENDFIKAQKLSEHADLMGQATYSRDGGLVVDGIKALLDRGDQQSAIRALASKYGVATASGKGAKQDTQLLNIINKYAPEIHGNLTATVEKGMRPGSPQAILSKAGGINAAEFSDVMGGKIGKDIKGVVPGLFTKNGMGIDEAGRYLAENGFITPQEAEDLNLVREFIKENLTGGATTLQGTLKYNNLGEVSFDTAQKALALHAQNNGLDVISLEKQAATSVKLPIPYTDGEIPSASRQAFENIQGIRDVINRAKQGVLDTWGKGENVKALADPKVEAALKTWADELRARKAVLVRASVAEANETRNFALLNYGRKRTFDLAATYLFPYQFWYGRTYANWVKRIATQPEILGAYTKYRHALEQLHGDQPDWWKYNLSTKDFGINTENPLFFNLEATINPLNGITGVDFEDPDKIVGEPGTFENFWTRTLNDLGKLGPSVWTPLTMATAFGLYISGEKDAASRWGGRLIPQTAPVKAFTSKVLGKPMEFDPMVQLLSGGTGIDPYEERRIGRALSSMVQDGTITAAQAQDAAYAKSGALWDEAYKRATDARSTATMMSFFGGVGMKPRTQEDMQIDQFYTDYRNLWAMNDKMSPDEFRVAMDAMRKQYPFMDTVLLSKRESLDRDRGYSYSVMSRIPPGGMTSVAKAVGIDDRLLNRFYETKGHIEQWPETDRMKFMSAIKDIGALLDVPADATQAEWSAARNSYGKMNTDMQKQFGSDISAKIDRMYEFDNPDDKAAYLKMFPEVQQALDFKAQYVVSSPLLSAYYNGLGQLENYYNGQKRADIAKQLGNGIWDTMNEYYRLNNFGETAQFKAFKAQHPEYKKYFDLNDKWAQKIDQSLAVFGNKLPKGLGAAIRPDAQATPQGLGAQDLQTQMTTPKKQWADLAPLLPNSLKTSLYNYFSTNKPLSASDRSRLERTAKALGLTLNDLISIAGSAVAQP